MTGFGPRWLGTFNTMDKAAEEALWHIDGILDDKGWDLPPLLLLVHAIKLDGGYQRLQVEAFTGWGLIVERYTEVTKMLDITLQALQSYDMRHEAFRGHDLWGMILAVETWLIEDKADNPEYTKEVLQMAEAHQLEQHPDRVEARLLFSMDRFGKSVMFQHKRDGVAQIVDGSTGLVDGRIPVLMDKLVQVLKS